MKEEPWFRDARQHVREIVNRAVDGLAVHVVPLFRGHPESLAPDHEGSGVLVSHKGRTFLASAGHCLRLCEHGLAIPDDQGELMWLEGSIIASSPPSPHRGDFLDLGVVELQPQEVSRLRTTRFVELREEALVPAATWVAPIVVVLGFAARDVVDHPVTSTVIGQLTQFGTSFLPDEDYRRAQVDQDFHILLRFRRESIMTARSVGAPPDWRGMSGGGAWVLPIAPADQAHPPAFAGLLLGRPPQHKKALQVTRADALYHFVRLHA